MVVLDNWSKWGTYILIEKDGYTIEEEEKVKINREGFGGFSEDNRLIGLYVKTGKLFFLYNQNHYEINSNSFDTSNKYIDKENRRFIAKINNNIVCDITYKPYVDPNYPIYGGEEDEFDFLLQFDNFVNNNSLEAFIQAMSQKNS